jgi:hypothetical protein
MMYWLNSNKYFSGDRASLLSVNQAARKAAGKMSLLFLLMCSTGQQPAYAERKALVIGNSNYTSSYFQKLRNPVNDANSFGQSLVELGFIVQKGTDLDLEKLDKIFNAFVDGLEEGDDAVVSFSGHGVQVDGENYFIPIGFKKATDETDIKYGTFNINRAVEKISKKNAANKIIFLDACRSSLFSTSRSGAKGLAPIQVSPNLLIAYSTSPGKTADDGKNGTNSPYMESLLNHINKPMSIEDLFKIIRVEVLAKTEGQQLTEELTQLTESFSFDPNFFLPSPIPSDNPPGEVSGGEFSPSRGVEQNEPIEIPDAGEEITEDSVENPNPSK